MTPEIQDLLTQSWRALLIVLVPAFIVSVVGGASSLLLALFGVRDEGLVYASRVVAMIGLAALFLPSCISSFVSLMSLALR